MKLLMVILLAGAAAGCASLSDIKTTGIDRQRIFYGEYRAAADCFGRQFHADHPEAFAVTRSVEGGMIHYSARLAVNANDPLQIDQYLFDVEFSGKEARQFLVITRTRHGLGGSPAYPDDMWATIQHCATANA